ncbi:MAG: NAD(P)/FAD-dependent oxidoreductase [Ruminococcaceae bacterium]|nr:NAD(P)/FAD-dependent oxidoreductase [Oscillospiraceae bacterium]
MFDVVVIGCGIMGASCAYFLSRYNLKVAVLEKHNDVCMETTRANSAIIHAGYDPKPGTLCAKYNVIGNELAKEICEKLSVAYRQIGSLVVAFSDDEMKTISELLERGIENGVPGVRIVEQKELREMEPFISDEALGALYAPTAAIVNPWEYGVAMAETAVRNGAEIFLNTKVEGIENKDGIWHILTNGESFEAKYVINAAGVWADDITALVAKPNYKINPSAGEYYLLDKSEGTRANHVIFQCPNELGKGVLVSPTVHGNLIVGPNAVSSAKDDTSTKTSSLDFVREKAVKSIPSINFRDNIRNFTGVRANTDTGDFIMSFSAENFLDLAGIKSPGLSAAPAIAQGAIHMLGEKGLELDEKAEFIDEREHIRFKELTDEEKNKLIKENPAYGRVICRCETITEGEILCALKSPIPPVSLDGIKRRAGTGMGRCQGGFCGPKVLEIMANYKNTDFESILQDDTGSYILTGETKNRRDR